MYVGLNCNLAMKYLVIQSNVNVLYYTAAISYQQESMDGRNMQSIRSA